MRSAESAWDVSAVLEAVESASPVDAVDAVTSKLAAQLDTDRVAFLIADFAGRALVRLGHGDETGRSARRRGDESAQVLSLNDEVLSRAVAGQHPVTVRERQGWRVLVPVTQRGEVLGLLEAIFDARPNDGVISLIQRAGHVLAFVVIANRRHTDLFEWGQRTTPFQLSAEIQRRLLPSAFTCEGGSFTVAGWLEPAATIGGDTFDYSLERDALHLSVTDAMGHGVTSALTATLCVGSLRNSRRVGASLLEQAAAADDAVREHASNSFVTGILGRLVLPTGVLRLVNAGHVMPLLLRQGSLEQVQLPVDLPFGLNTGRDYRLTELPLEAGDRLVFLTDGMLERRAAGLPLSALLSGTRELHPREATRHLADAVLEVAGPVLADDATILVLDWHGHHGRPRDSRAGADLQRE